MSDGMNVCDGCEKEKLKNIQVVYRRFLNVKENALNYRICASDLKTSVFKRNLRRKRSLRWPSANFRSKFIFSTPFTVLLCAVSSLIVGAYFQRLDRRCAVWNNFFVMELSRPVTDCNICRNVHNVLVLHNVTKSKFLQHAYSSRPMLVTGATYNWSALNSFSFSFFKEIYSKINEAYRSVEEECQFFPFRTKFMSLKDALNMPCTRAGMLTDQEEPWYIGWSNCNPAVGKILRQHYGRPHFLPEASELSAIDWIFMGWSGQGTSMHLDYVQRPSWQAQISGSKTWKILPPPECEEVCHPMNITVHKGDILLLDTNQWYHDTYIHPGEISITIGSEYD